MLQWQAPKKKNHSGKAVSMSSGKKSTYSVKTQWESTLTRIELRYKIVARFIRLPAATACWLDTDIQLWGKHSVL